MLSRNFVYNADDNATGNVTTTPTPDTQQATTNGSNAGVHDDVEKKFTQLDINKNVAREVKEAKAKTLEAVLKDLGIEDLSQAKAIIEAQKKKEDAEKTEAQKLAEQLAETKAQLESEKQARFTVEKQAREKFRDTELKALMNRAIDPIAALTLFKVDYGDKLAELLDENGEFNATLATTWVTDYQKSKSFLFKDGSPGSPSNRDGRIPEPNKEAKQNLTTLVNRTIKGSF